MSNRARHQRPYLPTAAAKRIWRARNIVPLIDDLTDDPDERAQLFDLFDITADDVDALDRDDDQR